MTADYKVDFFKKYRNDMIKLCEEQPKIYKEFQEDMSHFNDPSYTRDCYKDWLFDRVFCDERIGKIPSGTYYRRDLE